MFDLKIPCVDCPFRKGQGELFRLEPARLEQIRKAPAFQCHKTVVYDHEAQVDDGQWDDKWRPIVDDSRANQCAGLMAVLHRIGEPNQIMQVASRLGTVNLDTIDSKRQAYETWDDVLSAHAATCVSK